MARTGESTLPMTPLLPTHGKKVILNGMSNDYQAPEFLVKLLQARSPSGEEYQAQAVFDEFVEASADDYQKDCLGNRLATVNSEASPSLMLSGHMDELGLMIHYVDKDGFLYFQTVGGHDRSIIPGRRVVILTAKGPVKGVTGKRAIHLLSPEEREKIPQLHQMWIDIGASSKEEALKIVSIGDVGTYDQDFELIRGSIGVARAFDNKCGAYIVGESLRRLARNQPEAKVTAVASSQEEIGCRGATTSAFSLAPDFALAVDVGHATDFPDADNKRFGEFKLGKGPIIARGPNINPFVFRRLLEVADKEGIPYQVEGEPRPTSTDARAIQMAGPGVATGLLSVPLRYMHTPSEVVDLADVENTVRLMTAFAQSLKKGENGRF